MRYTLQPTSHDRQQQCKCSNVAQAHLSVRSNASLHRGPENVHLFYSTVVSTNAGRVVQYLAHSSVLFFSRPLSEGWPHPGRTFSIYPCSLSFWLTLPRRVLSTSWCCSSRPLCVAFLACVHLALFLTLSLSPGNSLVSSWCDHSMLASLFWRCLADFSLIQLC